MAGKIKLGNRPQNFKKTVTVKMLDGSEGAIDVTFKYRTRTEYGAFIDAIMEAAGEKGRDAGDEAFSNEKLWAKVAANNAEQLLQVVEAWNLDEELTKENIEQLADELPGAVLAIMETYRVAILEGRLGN
ncbi:MAG TPA: phage tail assembly chaperone [Noviherbaspirillum sp.]|jgi:hypothetical protein|uniref:phage tail assembly chaperone n=1 Tax=Noviherbaspirillum sp. TaxID=1926288 RepID=UPI002F93D326